MEVAYEDDDKEGGLGGGQEGWMCEEAGEEDGGTRRRMKADEEDGWTSYEERWHTRMRMEKVYQGEESPRQEKASDVANSLPSHYREDVDDNDKRGYKFNIGAEEPLWLRRQ